MKKLAANVYCFDCEWIPCARTGRLLCGLSASASDADVFDALWKRAGATKEKPRPFLKLALSQIVSISAVHRKQDSDGSVSLSILSFPPVADSAASERQIIGSFLETVAKAKAQLVGFNSAGADLPILIQRAIANRCHCPAFGERPEKPWQGPDYFHRFSEAHVDLAHILTAGGGYGSAVMPSLDEIATAALIPGKLDHSGSSVVDLWQQGDYANLTGYNETDACTTYLLWLRAAWFMGRLTVQQCEAEVRQFRGLLKDLAPTRPHLGRFLKAWTSLMQIGMTEKPDELPASSSVDALVPAAKKYIRIVAAYHPTAPATGNDREPASTCEITFSPDELDARTFGRLNLHLVPAGRNRFMFCRMGCDIGGNVVPGTDTLGRPILLPVATRDLHGLLLALDTTQIQAVDEWVSPDAA